MSSNNPVQQMRSPSNEPTLMVGDMDLTVDPKLIDALFLSTSPAPIIMRKSSTRNELKQNFFYQYNNFHDARLAWKTLIGARVPGMDPEFRLDVTFTKQKFEVCAFFCIVDVHFNRVEIYKLFSRYWSVLGLANYKFEQWHEGRARTTCFIRFSDAEDCMQAIRELQGFPVEGNFITMTASNRCIDVLSNHVMYRETPKLRAGLPIFHNFYKKRIVNKEEFNRMTMTSEGFFDDLEASRWSSVAFKMDVYEEDLNRQITLDYFELF